MLPRLLRPFRVLGIESSADDSAAAIVTSDRRILANIVEKQHHVHGKLIFSTTDQYRALLRWISLVASSGGIHPIKAQDSHAVGVVSM